MRVVAPSGFIAVSRHLLLVLVAFVGIILSGTSAVAQADPQIPPGDIRIHYFRPDGNLFRMDDVCL